MKYLQHTMNLCVLTVATLLIASCGGSGGGTSGTVTNPDTNVVINEPIDNPTPEPEPEPEPEPNTNPQVIDPIDNPEDTIPPDEEIPEPIIATVNLAGQMTFDRVLFADRYYRGLDYDNVIVQPARGLTVQLLDENNGIIAETKTDASGNYAFTVAQNQEVRVRLLAQLFSDDQAVWDIEVRDNTSGNALYVMDGALASSGSNEAQTRNLHAGSGWDGNAYNATRSAGPLAILDSIYDAVNTVVEAAPNVVLPPLEVYWSTQNIAISGDARKGHIGTSFFTSGGPAIYLLGAANNDSDEYDRGVIQHEFAHYIERMLGRSESIGGSHNQQSRLDMRVAFGEAWGNAFSGMASNDPLYRDSLGANQSLGFVIDVEARGHQNQGWFSEESVQAVLYDLFDSADDGKDGIHLGFKPIFDVLTSDDYLNFEGFASIFPFVHELKAQQPEHQTTIDELLESYDIYGKGAFGEGEHNHGGAETVLPIYHPLALNQTVNVCSNSQFQDSNGVDVRRFLSVPIPTPGNYTIRAQRTSGLATSNPQIKIYRQGGFVSSITTTTPNYEEGTRQLNAGTYVFEIYEQTNADGREGNGGLACFDITVE
jgi:hypothetical protein